MEGAEAGAWTELTSVGWRGRGVVGAGSTADFSFNGNVFWSCAVKRRASQRHATVTACPPRLAAVFHREIAPHNQLARGRPSPIPPAPLDLLDQATTSDPTLRAPVSHTALIVNQSLLLHNPAPHTAVRTRARHLVLALPQHRIHTSTVCALGVSVSLPAKTGTYLGRKDPRGRRERVDHHVSVQRARQ